MNTAQSSQPPNIFDQIRGQIDLGGLYSETAAVPDVVTTPANQVMYGPSMSELLASKRTTSVWSDLWSDIKNLWPFGSGEPEPEPPKGPSPFVVVIALAAAVGLVWYTARRSK